MTHQPSVTRSAATKFAKPRRLLVVSHALHYGHAGELFSYGPYVREIDIWADLFESVTIAAPFRRGMPEGDCVPFTRPNISVAPQREVGGDTLKAKVALLASVPLLVAGLARAMLKADAIHVRCPGNLGLLGAAMAPLFSRYLVAKYAGQWNGYEGESAPTRIQRRLLRSGWWRGPVTVYGRWPDQPVNIVPFFTSMMTAGQVDHAVEIAAQKRIGAPLRVLFSGTLQTRKRVDALIDAVRMLDRDGIALEVAIVGDGPEREVLRTRAGDLVSRGVVRFVGALPYDASLQWFEWAHALVLPSRHSEGWPKVIAEGMCYGLVCVGVAHGQVPEMLSGRGILLDTGSPEEIAGALRGIVAAPERYEPMMRAASGWARQFSLDGLRDAIAELLAARWKLPERAAPAVEPPAWRVTGEETR
ncbi:MAG: glycosyltransferase [Acidobacteriota bacterium]